MKNLTIILALSAAGLVACGDNTKKPDAAVHPDAPNIDAPIAFPAAPTLGAPIDRMGRPAINTALNAAVNNAPLKDAKKDAYNHSIIPTGWATTVLDPAMTADTVKAEFQTYLAVYDVLDKGTAISGAGCGNAALYAGPASATSYAGLATVLSDDELYVDTTKGTCNFYLSLEVEVATAGGVPHTQCGGRTLTHDVADTTYSLAAAGTNGFDSANNFAPRVTDGASVHADVSNDTFPFLGAPH
jgi:hypothetical protein